MKKYLEKNVYDAAMVNYQKKNGMKNWINLQTVIHVFL
jgi:hypothetical protein